QILEYILKLASAFGRVICSTGDFGNLLQRLLVDAAAKPTAKSAAAAKSAATTKPTTIIQRAAALQLLAAKRISCPVRGAKSDCIHPPSTIGGLLCGLQRRRAGIADPIGE